MILVYVIPRTSDIRDLHDASMDFTRYGTWQQLGYQPASIAELAVAAECSSDLYSTYASYAECRHAIITVGKISEISETIGTRMNAIALGGAIV